MFLTTLPSADGIVLRPFRESDAGMLRDLSTDPYVPLIGSLTTNTRAQDALDYIGRQQRHLERETGYPFCVAEPNGRALGTAGLWTADLTKGRAAIGCAVAPSATRRRVAVRALRALTLFGWALPKLFRIELCIEPWNVGSIRTAESAGHVREGLLRSHHLISDERTDMFL